jgi:hypothetical protein
MVLRILNTCVRVFCVVSVDYWRSVLAPTLAVLYTDQSSTVVEHFLDFNLLPEPTIHGPNYGGLGKYMS